MAKSTKSQGSLPLLTNQVLFHFIDVKPFLRNRRLLRKWVILVCAKNGVGLTSVSFNFCSDAHLLEMNRTFLKHDYLTDIITFDLGTQKSICGDIYISIDRVKDNSAEFGYSITNELHRVMIHGVLHLCGYKDKSKKESALMRLKEDESLSLLNEFHISRETY